MKSLAYILTILLIVGAVGGLWYYSQNPDAIEKIAYENRVKLMPDTQLCDAESAVATIDLNNTDSLAKQGLKWLANADDLICSRAGDDFQVNVYDAKSVRLTAMSNNKSDAFYEIDGIQFNDGSKVYAMAKELIWLD